MMSYEKLKQEKRRKIFTVSESDLIDVFSGRKVITNIPEGAICEGVSRCFERGDFGVRVLHESFPSVFETNAASEVLPAEYQDSEIACLPAQGRID